jgi:hypothetical protein
MSDKASDIYFLFNVSLTLGPLKLTIDTEVLLFRGKAAGA